MIEEFKLFEMLAAGGDTASMLLVFVLYRFHSRISAIEDEIKKDN